MLAFTAVCAVIFAVMGAGVRGSSWAVGVSMGIFVLLVMLSIHAGLFALTWAFSAVAGTLGHTANPQGSTPFNADLPGLQPSPSNDDSAANETAAVPTILDD